MSVGKFCPLIKMNCGKDCAWFVVNTMNDKFSGCAVRDIAHSLTGLFDMVANHIDDQKEQGR